MLRSGNVFLNACPGSGKTTSVAGRVAKLVEQGQCVALLSHTKVGARELADSVLRNHKIALNSDSFVGTIHSFVGKYILRPFGHLVTGSVVPVTMDPDEAARFYPESLDMRHFRFSESGSINYSNAKGSASRNEMNLALQGRLASAKAGVVDYDDGLYWSLALLRKFPKIAVALAARFDEIIVDEAQDSNESQIRILEALHASKLRSLVMVGDFDQSIYGFGGANPDRCREAATKMGLNEKRLTENHRASQALCNASAKFRLRSSPDTAVGEYASFGVPPVLIRYHPGEEQGLTAQFSSLIEEYEVQSGTSALLVRKWDNMVAFLGDQGPKLSKDLQLLLACARNESPLDSIRDLERLLTTRAFGGAMPPKDLDHLVLRSVSHRAARSLPPLEGDAYDWAKRALQAFDAAVRSLSPVAVLRNQNRAPGGLSGLDIRSIGGLSAGEHRVATIHGTKGESVDSIMIVASEREENWHRRQADVWASPLTQLGQVNITEELRIFYVALTRARRLAVLALPSTTPSGTITAFQRAGFLLK